MPLFEDRCSFPREAVTACGVQLLTMWRVRAGASYRRITERSRRDSQAKIHQAGQNLVVVRTDGGEGMLVAKGRRHSLTKGSLLLFDFPSLEEYHTVGSKWQFWWVELVATEPVRLPLHRVLSVAATPRENTRCEEIFDRLQGEQIEQRCLAMAAWQHLFYEWWIAADLGEQHQSPSDLAILQMLEAIKRKPAQPWTLDEMAVAAGMSRSTLRIACHQALGKSPTQLRIQLKLSHAHEFLRRGDRNVAEVATVLGFCDPYHFSKAFKKQFGYSPSQIHSHST